MEEKSADAKESCLPSIVGGGAVHDFFLPPSDCGEPCPHSSTALGGVSLLHLLRRDLCELYGPEDVVADGAQKCKAPILAAIGIF